MPMNLPAAALPKPPDDALANASLFLDFDGTLVELIDRPDAVIIDPALHDLLGTLGAVLPGRVAIVSGRSLAQLEGFFGEGAAQMALAGSHGAERRSPSLSFDPPVRAEGLDVAERALAVFASAHPGTILEPKSFGVTLHYRLAPDLEPRARDFVTDLAAAHGFEVQMGKMMVELKAAGGNKGDAVKAFMATPPMAGTRPWFIGDDLTDEAGFAAAAQLGGGGILVGAPRMTAATYSLADVAAVRAWLNKEISALA